MTFTERSTPLSRHLRMIAADLRGHAAASVNTAAELLEAISPVPQCAPTLAARLQSAYDKVKEFPENSPTGFLDLLALRNTVPEAIAALAGEPGAAQDQLSRLRQAILDNTQGDGFWLGEILLAVLAKETGFGSITRPERGAP